MIINEINGLNYDADLHMYILDKNYFTMRTAISLEAVLKQGSSSNITAVVNSYLTRASTVLYNTIFSFNPGSKLELRYLIATERELGETIRESLIELVNYWIVNGLDSSIINPIVNLDVERTVPTISQDILKSAVLPESVKEMFHSEGLDVNWHKIEVSDVDLEAFNQEEKGI